MPFERPTNLLFGTIIIIIHGEKDTNLFNAKTKREQQVILRREQIKWANKHKGKITACEGVCE
jgi:hypothetical protein